ncbi:MAG: M20/M25/M40 family metallo-hydrolase [Candidatus Eisenbacteria bacterium]|nr:M20/M25/M40 family metallo-hydrolase [Candidatus Eisenbacteria bacterium]
MTRQVTIALMALAVGAAVAAAGDLYIVPVDDGGYLTEFSGEGARVRHVGDELALIETATGFRSPLLRAAGAEAAGTVGDGERLYACYPRSGRESLAEHGRVILAEPLGAVIVAAGPQAVPALRAASFHVRELPLDMDLGEWFDATPAPLVRAREEVGESRVRGVVQDVLDAVSTDSLMAHVERLSSYSDGTPRSRHTFRDECLEEGKSYIVDRLRWYGATVDTQRFHIMGYSCEDDTLVVDYPAENITGTLPGTGRLQGYYIVCGHYDATASHSFTGDSMWWCDEAAPGADDNATGVAVALEAARVLADLTFPFDIRFVLFSGEELGLLGSEVYADSVAAAGDTIYGVLNVDMVGYKPQSGAPDTCHIVTNPGTTWLADWILDTVELYPSSFDDFSAVRIDQALAYSDHASFWLEGYDGLVAIEHWNPRERNPYYHTVEDTFGSIVASQLSGVGRAIAGSVARLAETDGTFNLAVFPEDFSVYPRSPETGDIVEFSVKVHAFGPDEDVDMTLTVWDGEPDEGELLAERSVSRAMGGGEVIYNSFYWLPDSGDLGVNRITARVESDGVEELSYSDNSATFEIRVNDESRLFVMEHYSYPNPAGHAGDLSFRYELSREAGASEIVVFDMTGQELGVFQFGGIAGEPPEGAGLSAGWNTVRWNDFASSADALASGVYIYKLRIYERGGTEPATEVTGRFAVVR